MRVLVVGGGGREHALCWALSRSPRLAKLWCAPGNPGIFDVAECVPIKAEDVAGLVAFALAERVDLVVVGPEAPLTLGLADACAAAGIACFGPSAAAARLEGSKAFFKEVAEAAGAPTARWAAFDDAEAARAHIRAQGAPIVVKADGLAAGKGVVVAASVAQAERAIDELREALGGAAATLVIEECLAGEEVSFFALCDGLHAVPLGAAQDHKRVGEGDSGPNTGGMGAYSPPPAFTRALEAEVMARCIRPVLAEMARRGTPFRGVLFAGLMLTADGPKLLEFNTRFGDPECQALLLRLESDLLPVLVAACEGGLEGVALRWSPRHSVVVVLAARGYPGTPERGGAIGGLEAAAASPGVRVFHAGTSRDEAGRIVAAGGRVLGIGATGATLREARAAAYAAAGLLDFPSGFCRRDIGARALRLDAPSTHRNRAALLRELPHLLPARGLVLEVASGTGQHCAALAAALPGLTFQPSEPRAEARDSIAAWCAGLPNVLPPLDLDVARAPWPIARADAVLCVNLIHIAPWSVAEALFAGAREVLAAGAALLLYGPFRRHGAHTAESNAAFDAQLRAEDLAWGVRDLDGEVAALAARCGFGPPEVTPMEANNLLVAFRRRAASG